MRPSRDEHGKSRMAPCHSIPKEVLEVAVAQATNKNMRQGRNRGAAQGRVARENARFAVPVGCTAHPLTPDHWNTAIDTPYFSPVVRMSQDSLFPVFHMHQVTSATISSTIPVTRHLIILSSDTPNPLLLLLHSGAACAGIGDDIAMSIARTFIHRRLGCIYVGCPANHGKTENQYKLHKEGK